jgi:SAM-dependent MidA family methyltransferase
MNVALYDPAAGFYGGGGGAGRGRDFITSPEVGPLFGAVVARALDQWWTELGSPDPFVVVEAGAGVGSLAASVLAAAPQCAPALRYVTVERSAHLRAQQPERLPLELPALVLGPATQSPDEEAVTLPRRGPLVTSLGELPVLDFAGVVVANELLDNLAFLLLERSPSGWDEIRVGATGDALVEVAVPAAAELAEEADRLAPGAPLGSRLPVQHEARAWLRTALSLATKGRVVAIDYGSESTSLADRPWDEWLRTYRGHGRAGHPLEDPGGADITCEVAWDQLYAVRAPTVRRSQAEFLRAHGIADLRAEAAAAWEAGAAVGGLDAVRARSRMSEADALVDPVGLGSFDVVEWAVGGRRRRPSA